MHDPKVIKSIFKTFVNNTRFLLKILCLPGFRFYSALIILFTFFISLIPLLNIELTKRLLNSIQTESELNTVIKVFILILLLQVIQNIISSFTNFLNEIFQLKLTNYVSELVMEKISSLDFFYIFSSSTIDKLYFLRTNSTTRIGSIFNLCISMFSSFITFIAVFIYLLNWIPLYAMMVALFSIPIGIAQYYFNNKNFSLSQKLNKYNREQFYLTYISTTPSFLKEIIQYSSMKYLVKKHSEMFGEILKPKKSLMQKETIVNVLTTLLGIFAIGLAQFKTIAMAFKGQILIGTLMSIIQSLGIAFQKVQSFIVTAGGFHSDWLYIDKLREFLEVEKSNKKYISNEHDIEIETPINLKAYNLSYSINGEEIFKNLNFEFISGSIVGITGDNGIGKSTLLDIIQGIKKETAGKLYFNNIPSTTIDDSQRIKLCQTLQQNPSRYEFTVRENVGLSNVEKLKVADNIMEFIHKVDPDSFIFKDNFNDDTRLGDWYEESRQLSGGQWQKLALYRLFYSHSPIYLIDEPTNNLDKNTLHVLENLFKLKSSNSIIIIVSHDFELLTKVCTDIYVMTNSGISQRSSSSTAHSK